MKVSGAVIVFLAIWGLYAAWVSDMPLVWRLLGAVLGVLSFRVGYRLLRTDLLLFTMGPLPSKRKGGGEAIPTGKNKPVRIWKTRGRWFGEDE